jgi:hypothetical protein
LNDESDFMNMNYRFVFCTEIIIKTWIGAYCQL